ncbi:S24 family peptidase [Marinifilum caeruleilacunae]|uniref:Peptidase S24/S26A/S26B/S26C domain-containing protein n=1 Tax=Marinifilum caeruleilacunae TaxID=2499076 RepID=A0ABX1X0M3_9BACT|nr:S24 family peptidase [Marinifilum caeruleilacunae]NOU61947.1 hypothetical protein [Marinifilum caeruleilacunae]
MDDNFSSYHNESVSQRVKKLITHFNYTIHSFEKHIGVSPNMLGVAIRKNTDIKSETLRKILYQFSNVNPIWLLTGDGAMLLDSMQHLTGNQELNNKDFIDIKLIDRQKHFDNLLIEEEVDQLITIQVRKIDELNYDNTFAINVKDDYMEPTLLNGEKIIIEALPIKDIKYLTGIVVLYFNNEFVIKRIQKNLNGILTLSCDSMKGTTFEVRHQDIKRIFKVKYSYFRPIE